MFFLCPNCQFLVPSDPASGRAPGRCPRCDGMLTGEPTHATDGSSTAAGPAAGEVQVIGISAEEKCVSQVGDTSAVRDTASVGSEEVSQEHGSSTPVASTPVPQDVDDGPVEDSPVGDRVAAHRASIMPSNTDAPGRPNAHVEPARAPDATLRAPAAPTAPAFLDSPGQASSRRRGWWQALAAAALLALLGMQILLADRTRLAADARWRPLLQAFCGIVGCRLPNWRQPEAFTMLARDVHMHPQRAGALRATAAFRNDARWAQPWPALRLTLSDADGRTLGARTFSPQAYLDTTSRVIESGQTARVVIDLHEPGPDVVAFAFEFR